MSAKNTIESLNKESIVDDISNSGKPDQEQQKESLDEDKMSALKAKLAQKQKGEDVSAKILKKRERSIEFGVVGSGHAGSRLSAVFGSLGYDAVACNTSMQDLKHINLPESNKLLLEYGLGGAGKETEIGKAAAEAHRDSINELVSTKLANAQVLILCTSLGGGSGAGSAEVLVDIMSSTGKPLMVIAALTMANEDAQAKQNALNTLAKLTALTQSKKIDNLFVVDNAKLESIYSDVSQMDFFDVANNAIVQPLDMFNTLTAMPTPITALDPTDFSKILLSGALTVYGQMTVTNYEEDTAIAEAIMSNLDNNLLASGFDLKQSKYVGFVVVANKDVWSKIPSSSINYANAIVNESCGQPLGVFKGAYVVDSEEDNVKVYSMFSGLLPPHARVEQLKNETKDLVKKNQVKDEARDLNLKITGEEEVVSAAQKVKDKIASKSSAFGKLNQQVIDRRKK